MVIAAFKWRCWLRLLGIDGNDGMDANRGGTAGTAAWMAWMADGMDGMDGDGGVIPYTCHSALSTQTGSQACACGRRAKTCSLVCAKDCAMNSWNIIHDDKRVTPPEVALTSNAQR